MMSVIIERMSMSASLNLISLSPYACCIAKNMSAYWFVLRQKPHGVQLSSILSLVVIENGIVDPCMLRFAVRVVLYVFADLSPILMLSPLVNVAHVPISSPFLMRVPVSIDPDILTPVPNPAMMIGLDV